MTKEKPNKVPALTVPANVFLILARLYKELPQESVDREIWYQVRDLERRAYRKLKNGK